MGNIILEEMKRQWEKGYIKVLLIVILLISILTGCFQVIKVKEAGRIQQKAGKNFNRGIQHNQVFK